MTTINIDDAVAIHDALCRGVVDAYAREIGPEFTATKLFYVVSATTWGAVTASMLRGFPGGVPKDIAAMRIRIDNGLGDGRIEVGYEGVVATICVDIVLGSVSFMDRARVPLIDAVKAFMPIGFDAIEIAASSLTWGLFHGADPRVPLDNPRCLGCRTRIVDTIPDGVFIIRADGASTPRVVSIPLT